MHREGYKVGVGKAVFIQMNAEQKKTPLPLKGIKQSLIRLWNNQELYEQRRHENEGILFSIENEILSGSPLPFRS